MRVQANHELNKIVGSGLRSCLTIADNQEEVQDAPLMLRFPNEDTLMFGGTTLRRLPRDADLESPWQWPPGFTGDALPALLARRSDGEGEELHEDEEEAEGEEEDDEEEEDFEDDEDFEDEED